MAEIKIEEDRFRHRLVIGDLSEANGVVLKDLNINFDRPISSTTMQLRKLFKNLHS